MFAFMDGLGRALFKPSAPAEPRSPDPGPFYWKVMFIDQNGVLQKSTVRVITLHSDLRRLTVWCDALGRECVLKISKIVEASDLQSGRKVNLHRWLVGQQTPSV
ncbi:MAG: hypothetical protein PSV40_17955 [Polaromonas sp.]|nr:hypothetical protein [Polaromonas sp.]MDI1270971.1 hypothetical protein [Polaromonas sp.]